MEQWVHKGDRLYCEGRIEYSQTQDEQGNTRYWTDVVVNDMVMLGSSGPNQTDDFGSSRSGGSFGGGSSSGPPLSEPDDDLPF